MLIYIRQKIIRNRLHLWLFMTKHTYLIQYRKHNINQPNAQQNINPTFESDFTIEESKAGLNARRSFTKDLEFDKGFIEPIPRKSAYY